MRMRMTMTRLEQMACGVSFTFLHCVFGCVLKSGSMEQMMRMMMLEQMACGVSLAAEAGTQLSALQLYYQLASLFRAGRDCDDDDADADGDDNDADGDADKYEGNAADDYGLVDNYKDVSLLLLVDQL